MVMLTTLVSASVLVFGDSHLVGPFGQALDRGLREKQAVVATYGSCGSIGKWWITGKSTNCGYFERSPANVERRSATHATPKLDDLLRRHKPDVVIVNLSTNYVNVPSDEAVRSDLRVLVEKIRATGARCFWLGPPKMRRFEAESPRLERLLREVVTPVCDIFDSRAVTSYPAQGGDGVHFGFPAGIPIARAWASAFLASLP